MGYNSLGNGYYPQFPVLVATQIMYNLSPLLLDEDTACISLIPNPLCYRKGIN